METHKGLLASLRQSLSKSSVGSLLASYRASIQKDVQETFGEPIDDVEDGSYSLIHNAHDSSASSCRARPVSMAGVKQTVVKIATRGRARASSLASSSISAFSRISSADEPAMARVSSADPPSREDGTPPLTPESTFSSLGDSPQTQYPALYGGFEPTPPSFTDDVDELYRRSRPEVRRGKRPQYIQSFTNVPLRRFDQSSRPITPSSNISTPLALDDNVEEWLGLEYALEVSKADFQPQPIEVDCGEGEYSKSRESWAAIHYGSLDPGIEEWAFQQWQRWHDQLEEQDARRRAQRTMDFLTVSTHRSWLYLQERKLRDWINLTKQFSVDDAEQMELLDSAEKQLTHIEEYLQAEYDTVMDRHDKASLLKRSCSLSCIYDPER
ncbi:hypothetical protein L226DRAFT_116530 [Lentinus tigrinus ALCF2SS1-7]|uniref:uncharacterized protein n=1 Tax=Lentinus tigrinus ALCF2SS1-7 TaxID=1328758 RepID=UPI001166025E|nr:hypothetical protein L226DRAFT_116530 [Lentinus tigrinus ALCF2SS1-7]